MFRVILSEPNNELSIAKLPGYDFVKTNLTNLHLGRVTIYWICFLLYYIYSILNT